MRLLAALKGSSQGSGDENPWADMQLTRDAKTEDLKLQTKSKWSECGHARARSIACTTRAMPSSMARVIAYIAYMVRA